MKHLRYLQYVLKHKYYVFTECLHWRHPILGLLHDWSKFLPSEWFPYANHFYGKDAEKYKNGEPDPKFQCAVHIHLQRNKHHWQWWMSMDRGSLNVYEMPRKYVEEMLCDWAAAALAKGQGREYSVEWYTRYKGTMVLGPLTKKDVETVVYKKKEGT